MSDEEIQFEKFDDDPEEVVPTGERWDPLGAAETDTSSSQSGTYDRAIDGKYLSEELRIRTLEEEQEILQSSLLALTTHFAQVQFRLRQICDASITERDDLLKNLEVFAFTGIGSDGDTEPGKNLLNFIPEPDPMDSEKSIRQLIEKQKIIIDEVRSKLKWNLNDDRLPDMSEDDIRQTMDKAFTDYMRTWRIKDTLVSQLKTQVTDLERFVALTTELDEQSEPKGKLNEVVSIPQLPPIENSFNSYSSKMRQNRRRLKSFEERPDPKNESIDQGKIEAGGGAIIKRAQTIFNMFAVTQLPARTDFQTNTLKKTAKGCHWGDLRAQLEVDIQELINLAKQTGSIQSDASDTDDDIFEMSERSRIELISNLTSLVRRQFCQTLQQLIEHGLRDNGTVTTTSLVPFIGCFGPSNGTTPSTSGCMHVWELILEYYHIKNGERYNETPARKLSLSFNLDIGHTANGTTGESYKQSLLSAIGNVIAIHAPYKRSYNSHFKAWVTAGLNSRKLSHWLHAIFQCTELIRTYYTDWSYVQRTGFRDAMKSLDRLAQYQFDLPVDLAVRQFKNIKDVFM